MFGARFVFPSYVRFGCANEVAAQEVAAGAGAPFAGALFSQKGKRGEGAPLLSYSVSEDTAKRKP